jgi:hypothetical protein
VPGDYNDLDKYIKFLNHLKSEGYTRILHEVEDCYNDDCGYVIAYLEAEIRAANTRKQHTEESERQIDLQNYEFLKRKLGK